MSRKYGISSGVIRVAVVGEPVDRLAHQDGVPAHVHRVPAQPRGPAEAASSRSGRIRTEDLGLQLVHDPRDLHDLEVVVGDLVGDGVGRRPPGRRDRMQEAAIQWIAFARSNAGEKRIVTGARSEAIQNGSDCTSSPTASEIGRRAARRAARRSPPSAADAVVDVLDKGS